MYFSSRVAMATNNSIHLLVALIKMPKKQTIYALKNNTYS